MRPRKPEPDKLLVSHTQIHQEIIPHPELLERYERLLPGTAERLLRLAESETEHRRALERQAQSANATAQSAQIDLQRQAQALAGLQTRKAFISDAIGQVFGLIVALACVAAAVWLAERQPWVAGLLAGIPSAAVIRAFFARGK